MSHSQRRSPNSRRLLAISNELWCQVPPEFILAWCHLAVKLVDSRASLSDKEGFHLENHRRTTRQQRSTIPGLPARYLRRYRPECGPLTAAKDVTFSVPVLDCTEFSFCGLIIHFYVPARLVKI